MAHDAARHAVRRAPIPPPCPDARPRAPPGPHAVRLGLPADPLRLRRGAALGMGARARRRRAPRRSSTTTRSASSASPERGVWPRLALRRLDARRASRSCARSGRRPARGGAGARRRRRARRRARRARPPTSTSRCPPARWPWPSASRRGVGATCGGARRRARRRPGGRDRPAARPQRFPARRAWRATSRPRLHGQRAGGAARAAGDGRRRRRSSIPPAASRICAGAGCGRPGPACWPTIRCAPLRAVRLEATLGLRLTPAAARLVRAAAPALAACRPSACGTSW